MRLNFDTLITCFLDKNIDCYFNKYIVIIVFILIILIGIYSIYYVWKSLKLNVKSMKKTTIEAYKKNTIWIAKHHRKYCEGENCNISLYLLLEMAEKAGCKFTKKEKLLFI